MTFLGVATVVMVALAFLAITLAESRRTATFPSGSPQKMVQDYLKAISDGQKVKAFSYVAQESSCEQADMDVASGAPIDRTIIQFARINGDRGTVGIRSELNIASVYGGKTSMDHTFSLVRENQQWKLTGKIWPMETCGK